MSNNDDLEINTFESNVFAAISALQEYQNDKQKFLTEILEYSKPIGEIVFNSITREIRTAYEVDVEIEEINVKSKEILNQKIVKKKICAILISASGDAFEIAKLIIPILAGLNIAGTTNIPLNPVLFASVSLLIARMGVASLCVDYPKSKIIRIDV